MSEQFFLIFFEMDSGKEKFWFVGMVKSCQEKKVSERLAVLGYEHYLPVQRVVRKWSDRRKVVDKLVLPRYIFVRCTESERVRSLEMVPALFAYLMDSVPRRPARVRESDMRSFRMMVEHGESEVAFVEADLSAGDVVKVVNGPLKGIECRLVKVLDNALVAVSLGRIGYATMELPPSAVRKIPEESLVR